MKALDEKVALVTGAGSGLGKAVVQRFVEEGASVCGMDISKSRLEDLEKAVSGVFTITGNVISVEDNLRAVKATIEKFNKLDILIPNAGVFDNFASLEEIPMDKINASFDEIFDTDVKGYLLSIKAALPEIVKTKGSIIVTASTAGLNPGYGGILYTAAKHAVSGLVKQLAHELAAKGVRVNGVAPGYLPTNLVGLQTLGQKRRGSPPLQKLLSRIPLGFIPKPSDLAGLYVLLASQKDGSAITGQLLLADAGTSVGYGSR